MAKEFQKLKLEKLFCDACISGTNPNNKWFAEQLGVSARTIRNYWYERQELMRGPSRLLSGSVRVSSKLEALAAPVDRTDFSGRRMRTDRVRRC